MRHLHLCILAMLVMSAVAGCTATRRLYFADENWHISRNFGQIINSDTTYRMTFGERLIPVDMPVISSHDSLMKYPGLDRFIADILHTARLDSAEILFYAPEMTTMIVRPRPELHGRQPSSVSSNIDDEHPYTMWVYEDFGEDWIRKDDEMFTYTYVRPRQKQILVVDFFTYDQETLAQIFIFQTATSATERFGIGRILYNPFFRYDVNDRNAIEFWASTVNGHRKLAFGNYRIGQEIRRDRAARYTALVAGADSCFVAGDYAAGLSRLESALTFNPRPDRRVLFNIASAAAHCGDSMKAFSFLRHLADEDASWYLPEETMKEFDSLGSLDGWRQLSDTITSRRERIEAGYDKPLRRRLKAIGKADQEVRHRFLAAYRATPRDSALIDSLTRAMHRIDSLNLAEIKDILDVYGWPGKDLVGDACSTIWLVIQHSDIDTQKEALPMLKEGVIRGDLDRVQIAMLEDRILVNSGQPQIYGTQYWWDESDGTRQLRVYPVKDPDKVDLRRESIGLDPLDETYGRIRAMNR